MSPRWQVISALLATLSKQRLQHELNDACRRLMRAASPLPLPAMQTTLSRIKAPFVTFQGTYHRLSLKWKFAVWVFFVGALVGIFGGTLLGVGKMSDNLGQIIVANGRNGTGISLIGHVYSIDIPSRTVQISWLIVGCGDFQLPYTLTYGVPSCGRLGVAADFYVDGASTPNSSYDPTAQPYSRPDNNSLKYVQALNEFQTSHLLEISAWNGLDQQYAYPFDTYFLESSIIARDPDTNDSLPILTYYTVDSTNNFSPYVLEDSPTMTTGSDGSITLSRFMYMTFRRTIFTQFFVVSLFAVNWALTGVVLYITLSANEGNEVGESILLLPLSVIVTIPALRALWIGAPVFGLLFDSCGLFLQMVIVALCSIFLVVDVGLSTKQERELRKQKHSRQSTKTDMEGIPMSASPHEWGETDSLKHAQTLESAAMQASIELERRTSR